MQTKIFEAKTNKTPDLEKQVNDWLTHQPDDLEVLHTNLVVDTAKDLSRSFYTLIIFYSFAKKG